MPTSYERDLISPSEWKGLYDQMPEECKKVVDDPEPQCVGIGRNEELGWFVCFSGQGPGLHWSEKHGFKNPSYPYELPNRGS